QARLLSIHTSTSTINSHKHMSTINSHKHMLMVISFIPYIEDSVLGLISQDSGLFLYSGGQPRETKPERPLIVSPQAHLTCSLGNSLLNTLTLRGVTVYSNGPCMQGSLSRPGGGGETNVAPHLPRSETKNIHQAKSTHGSLNHKLIK